MELRVLSLLINCAVIVFIGLKTIDTACFNAGDINLAMGALIFAVIVEIVSIKKK